MASADRAPDWVATGTPQPLRGELETLLGADRLATRALDLVRYASDASPYRLIPRAVAVPRDTADVVALLGYARRSGTPLAFRAGGTSLNGQSQTDGILVDVRRHWRGLEILDGGARVRVRPGTVLGHVNKVLAPHGRRLGPDPASTDIACIGGVIANNSGGMRCGVVADAYRTLRSLTFVLPSGTTIDTAAPGAEAAFARAEPELAAGLLEIRDELRADAELRERVARKFEIKNTTGYRLCAFLDADTPLEIFRRLIVGSEGTLAFVAEAVFDTVALGEHALLALLLFEDIDAAADAVPSLVAAGSTATELMVAPTLIAAAYNMPGTPEAWKTLPPASAAVLVEFRAGEATALYQYEAAARKALHERELLEPADFVRDRETIAMLWHVREGMHGLLSEMRPDGVSLIIEDVCVPPARVAEAAKDLQELLGTHGFLQGVAGHASAGNLHFMLMLDFGSPAELERYEAFMHGLVDLIVDKYDGSLKAEHGTGINMAPYVEREWGAKATRMMRRVKQLADPGGVLAPGVLLTDDPGAHLRNLKSAPVIEAVASKCIECGFCEPVCPSRDLTTTPRQRILIRREMARQPAGSAVSRALEEQYEYDGLQTCAADGTCMLVCPVGIDTGKLVKELRAGKHSEHAEQAALRAARGYGRLERLARTGLQAGGSLSPVTRVAARAARLALSHELVPEWPAAMPHPAPPQLPATSRAGAAAVYMPACINRIFGRPRGAPDEVSLPAALVAVSARAGLPVWIPEDAGGHCCATPWTSKGYAAGATHMANHTIAALWRWSGEAALPVVIDASSCAHGLGSELDAVLTEENRERRAALRVLDSVAWAHDHLLGRLTVAHRLGSAAVHPTCATRHLGLDAQLTELASALADEVVVPPTATCCGFAGDRGFLHPELTAAATAPMAAELAGRRFDAYMSSNRTCEVGLQQATGAAYTSVIQVLERLTRD